MEKSKTGEANFREIECGGAIVLPVNMEILAVFFCKSRTTREIECKNKNTTRISVYTVYIISRIGPPFAEILATPLVYITMAVEVN